MVARRGVSGRPRRVAPGRARRLAVVVLLALAGSHAAVTSTPAAAAPAEVSTSGTDFWVAFPRNWSTPAALELFVAGDVDTTGTITGTPLDPPIDFTVTAGSVTTVSIPITAESSGTGVQDIGLRVTAADPVSLYGINRRGGSSDAFTAIPVPGLGTRYRIVSASSTVFTSIYAVVATADGTTVSIDGGAGITLEAGEVYVAEPEEDPSGILVESTEPVAVFSGHQCSNFKGAFCDHMMEQLPPTDAYGSEFAVVRFANEDASPDRTKDAFKIVADVDGTSVSVDGVLAGTIDAGESLVVEPYGLDGASTLNGGIITTTQPALVVQFMSTGRYRNAESTVTAGDPAMTLVTPTDQYRRGFLFATMAAGFVYNAVNVVIPTAAVGSVRLDDAPLADGTFQQLGTSEYSAAQIVIAAGSHSLTAATAFSATVYGANGPDSYALPGGVGASVIEASFPTPEASDDEDDGGGGGGAGGGPVLDCGADAIAGSQTTCTVTGGDPGIDILWQLRDAEGMVIAEGPVTLDDRGAGDIELALPPDRTGSLTLELVAWGVEATFDAASPVPVRVSAGLGPSGDRIPSGRSGIFALILTSALGLAAAGRIGRRDTTGPQA